MSRRGRFTFPLLLALAAGMGLSSCGRPFDVNVATPEPLKVDVDMDVHVYQHGLADEKAADEQATYRSTMESRRNRMAEIQELKNNRIVGENHQGKLSIINKPAGDYGEYVEDTVEAENRDREFLMQYEAEQKNTTVESIRREQWRHWRRKSFPGEWIEVQNDDGSGYRWEQKEAAE
ncbi:MAG: DUF1318 domain-containing protein [Verrucomicrobiales bacterium]